MRFCTLQKNIPQTLLYEVAVLAPISDSLTYLPPIGRKQAILPGCPVLVPLSRRRLTGYVLGLADETKGEAGRFTLKPIDSVISEKPFFPAEMLPFYRWIARYYHHPIGEVLRTALPLAPNIRDSRRIVLSPAGEAALDAAFITQSPEECQDWLHRLLQDKALEPATLRRISRHRLANNLLRKLERQGLVTSDNTLSSSGGRAKTARYLCLADTVLPPAPLADTLLSSTDFLAFVEAQQGKLNKAPRKALQLFWELGALQGRNAVAWDELRQHYPLARPHVRTLLDIGLLREEERRVYRDPFGETPRHVAAPKALTEEQEEVLGRLLPAVEQKKFAPFVLFGVTGSGKTEVYLQAVQYALEQGQSALVLVPEIALASQLEAHFYARFGVLLAVLHSGLADGERLDQWQRVLDGEARVVLGARSALFAPLVRLGLVIVDEEHEPAYKQEDKLCYNGRDLAVLRAHLANCPVVLGSATPSVVSFYHCLQGKYSLLSMTRRVGGQSLPEVEIVDMSAVSRSRPDLTLSDSLTRALSQTLEDRQQSLLFINRRGFASFMLCRDCGHILQCKHCQVSLTLHRNRSLLLCHYCGFSRHPSVLCPACQSPRVRGIGLGAERIEEEARQLFPEARIARLDSDTASQRQHYLKVLKAMRNQEIDILIGTQMIAKGLHFPHITLVGVVSADSGLAMPDYKASERTFSLLSQVIGRSGRGEQPGRVIVQTYQPRHYAIRFAREHNYRAFYEQEIAARKPLAYPPFSRLVNIRFTGPEDDSVRQSVQKAAALLHTVKTRKNVKILGPSPAPLPKIKDLARWQLLLQSSSPLALQELCEELLCRKTACCPSTVLMHFDVDPENML